MPLIPIYTLIENKQKIFLINRRKKEKIGVSEQIREAIDQYIKTIGEIKK